MTKRDRDELSDAIAEMIALNEVVVSIEPSFIATGAMDRIGFKYEMHHAGWYGCYQHMMQLAREQLRGKFDPEARAQQMEANQLEMFEGLQRRYPVRPRRTFDGEWADPVYVLRDHLSEADRWFNIDKLGRISIAYLKHSDALRAETIEKYGPRRNVA